MTGPTSADDPRGDEEVAASVLTKLAALVGSLDDRERAALGALLAPGVALAFAEDPEVVGFSADEPGVAWWPGRLPEHLAGEVRRRHVEIRIDPA